MAYLKSFPLPPRRPGNLADQIFDSSLADTAPYATEFVKRKYSKAALQYSKQYYSLENRLLKGSYYVSFESKHSTVSSVEFGEIIKGAANIFEIICCDVFEKIYFYNQKKDGSLCILNFLALDIDLELSHRQLYLLAAEDQFVATPEVTSPFNCLKSWDKKSPVPCSPDWWNAYNKLKHTNIGLDKFGTLANALASLAAVFVLIDRIFGYGVVQGMRQCPDDISGFLASNDSSRLFYKIA